MLRMCSRTPPAPRKASAGLRSMLPQSRNTIVRSPTSAGGSETSPSRGRKPYSWGSGRSWASMNMTQSLPISVRIARIATSEPIASPSGFSWATTTSRPASRSSERTRSRAERSPLAVTGLLLGLALLLVDQLRDAHPLVHRVVVLEGERRRVLERQLIGEAPLEEAVGRAQAIHAGHALGVAAENAHVDASVAEIGAGL